MSHFCTKTVNVTVITWVITSCFSGVISEVITHRSRSEKSFGINNIGDHGSDHVVITGCVITCPTL
jgi:hypothetical protein